MDKEELQRQYDEAGSVSELGRRLGIAYTTTRYRLERAGIEIRGKGFVSPRTVEIKRGSEHHNWKGGLWKHSDGYLYEYAPDHPTASREWPYVLQHRLVIERVLGRYLTADEDVHHKDESQEGKTNNDPSNLVLTTRSGHTSHHAKKKARTKRGTFA
jgi:hypothetical protein